MKKENDSLKQGNLIEDEYNQSWEICNEFDNNPLYEYKTINVSKLKARPNTYSAIQRVIDSGMKTNIHFIYSKITHNRAMDILKGKDVWKGKVDIDRLNAVIFLLFKPQGSGRNLMEWIPTKYQLKTFGIKILHPESKFKVGMDSCLANHVLQYEEATPFQAMSIDTCEAARMSGYITPDMKFKPCSFADSSSEVNLKGTNIEKIWNTSHVFKGFRNHLMNNKMSCPIGFQE